MPLSPKRVMHRKVQRGREKGNATRINHIDFGDIALVAMEPTWLDARVIEAARIAINRKLDRKGKVWIRVFPDKPVSKKPAEVRMGKGKVRPITGLPLSSRVRFCLKSAALTSLWRKKRWNLQAANFQ